MANPESRALNLSPWELAVSRDVVVDSSGQAFDDTPADSRSRDDPKRQSKSKMSAKIARW